MKTRLLFLCLLIGMNNLLLAQNDRNILRYSIENQQGETYHITLTITSIDNKGIVLHWNTPGGEEGNITLSPVAWKSGIRGFWEKPLPGADIKLGADQTVASFSQDFYSQIKQTGRAKYDGIEYIEDKRNENASLVIGSQPVDIVFLKSVKGDIKVWMLDNPVIPLVVLAENIIPGYTIKLEDAGTFFFWNDPKNYKVSTVPEVYTSGRGFVDMDQNKRKRFKDLSAYLPSGHVKDASIDYTAFLQKGLDENKYILMPDFPVMINDSGLTIKNNQTVFFQRNSQLILKPSDKQRYEMLRIMNVKNVTILNANLVGDRDSHLGQDGEWGMGISIRGSKNIKVKNANIRDCWGDGIYVGRLKNPAKNIRIENCLVDNVRRNGLSVISGIRLNVINCVFSNTNGTDPQCGVDIEPNNTRDMLRRIHFKNNITYNNKHSGLLVYLNESPKKDKRHKVTISIDNNFDDQSLNPVRISGFFLGNVHDFKPMKGEIKIKGLGSKSNKPSIVNKNRLFPPVVLR